MTNVYMKDENIKFSPKNVKSTNIYGSYFSSIIVNKITYVTHKDNFVTEMIVNVTIMSRLDENVNNFLLEKKSIFFIGEKISLIFLDLNVSTFH